MGWKVLGSILPSPNTFFQYAKFHENTDLVCCRSRFIIYNNPTFTGLKMGIYSLRNGLPFMQLALSSNTLTKAEISTLANGVKEVYFNFNHFQAKKNEVYAFMPILDGYVSLETSHVGWKRSYPDPICQTNFDNDVRHLRESPFDIHFIGAGQ
jgi:hypothetical protein